MTAGAAERGYRIGEVAERVGITTRTIRYYEELGLLGTLADRSKGTHRLYSRGGRSPARRSSSGSATCSGSRSRS